jgi:hypothetical protein
MSDSAAEDVKETTEATEATKADAPPSSSSYYFFKSTPAEEAAKFKPKMIEVRCGAVPLQELGHRGQRCV